MNGATRGLDDLGRVVIPADILEALGAVEGDRFRIQKLSERAIQLTLLKDDSCMQCQTTENIIQSPFGPICENCLFNFVTQVFHDNVDEILDSLHSSLRCIKEKARPSTDGETG